MNNILILKHLLLLIILSFVTQATRGQIMLIKVKNDRLELAKAIDYLNSSRPREICVNVDLTECHEGETDDLLAYHLEKADNLLMRSKVHKYFNEEEYRDLIGCSYLYPDGVTTGFINLICNPDDINKVEKFQIINTFRTRVRYHFAVMMAFSLNEQKTYSFINSQENLVKIDFNKNRKFDTYDINSFYEDKVSRKILEDKVIIIEGISQFEESYLVPGEDGIKRMTTSEIFANIACQIVDD